MAENVYRNFQHYIEKKHEYVIYLDLHTAWYAPHGDPFLLIVYSSFYGYNTWTRIGML